LTVSASALCLSTDLYCVVTRHASVNIAFTSISVPRAILVYVSRQVRDR